MFKFNKENTTKMNFNYNYPQLAREAGFRLRQYKDGPLDWRLLGSFEIERLVREQSLEDIDKALVHLSEAPLGSALIDTNILDSGIAKYFIVSQFGIQFLLFCRNFLDETVQELRESHAESQFEIARLKKLLSEANNEILQLHKKMTQMEAIHEVIYPCHLCTKNFANNEALNIHIGRKHGGGSGYNEPHNRNKTASPPKERAKDLTLINTIKLELEIKQLKERLNNAEKEIKARGVANSSKSSTPREVECRNVAIQSNLSEEKEKNEAKADDFFEADVAERQKQLEKLQTKIYDIEEWRATQLANNEESIAEIKRRLSDIAHALERTTAANIPLGTPVSISEAAVFETNERSLERRLSVEDLERVLSEKVAEIGKASTEKLAEIVHNMEVNYRDKLFELEREVKAAATSQKQMQALMPIEAKVDVSKQSIVVKPAPRVKRATAALVAGFEDEILQITKSDADEGEGTYSIELKDARVVETKTVLPISSLESNRTFVKILDQKNSEKESSLPKNVIESSSDTTDISESLSEDDASEKKVEPLAKPRVVEVAKVAEDSMKKAETALGSKCKRPKSPKKFVRKDAKNLAAKRLEKVGLDMRSKSLTSSTLKRVNSELQEKRYKLKQTYPNYFATRNRIKKFVDKLCSRKLPTKAEKMLSNKTALQPLKASKSSNKQADVATTSDDSEQNSDESEHSSEREHEITKETHQQHTKDDFKKRLELLLASPVKRPVKMELPSTSKASFTNKEEKPLILTKPMPVPRKRVMFNTATGGQM